MKKFLQSTVFVVAFSSNVFFPGLRLMAQDTVIDFNNVRANVNASMPFFNDAKHYKGGMEVPKGSGTTSIYAANWWLAADRPDASIAVAAETYGFGTDFISGPKANNYDSLYQKRWGKVWVITKSDIYYHLDHYQDAAYQAFESITSWPAHGDTTNGEPWLVAPFFDADGDGKYIPSNGDYPAMRGDVAAFLVRNDVGSPKTETGAAHMGVQLNLMFYSYSGNAGALENTIFLNTTVINIGDQALNNLKLGMWTEFELGNPSDNYIGTDSIHQAVYCYNGDGEDDDAQFPGYGKTPPCQAFTFLNTDLVNSIYFNNGGEGPVAMQAPTGGAQYYAFLHNRMRDNNPFPYQYCFGGNPDGSFGVSEITEQRVPGSRRIVGITDAGSLLPGESVCRDGAFVWSRAESGNQFASVEKMKTDLELVRSFYDEKTESACNYETGIKQLHQDMKFNIYPNPARHLFTVELAQGLELNSIILHNAIGQEVLKAKETTISVDALPAGIYTVRINTTKGNSSQLLVLQ